jgi:hypothetical protein
MQARTGHMSIAGMRQCSLLSPPPLRGRDREGGKLQALSSWLTPLPTSLWLVDLLLKGGGETWSQFNA